jgi:hypothetical protein
VAKPSFFIIKRQSPAFASQVKPKPRGSEPASWVDTQFRFFGASSLRGRGHRKKPLLYEKSDALGLF